LMLFPAALLAVPVLVITGKIMQKGVKTVFIVAVGFISFIYFNWRLAHMTLDVSSGYIAYTMIFRAVGMALLTVPLTTLAVSTLEPKDIPQGAALNNMMRQLGGSFGISIFDTYVTRRAAVHRTDLITHISAGDPQVIERINSMTSYFQSKG